MSLTDPQRLRLWKILRENGLSSGTIRVILKEEEVFMGILEYIETNPEDVKDCILDLTDIVIEYLGNRSK
jgi:hypothetical protein